MNAAQKQWWDQARSDHVVLTLVNAEGVEPCHKLHYLQMTAEKLGKAYLWRTGNPPGKTHRALGPMMKSLAGRSDTRKLAKLFGFGNDASLVTWLRKALPLVSVLEDLAPAEAIDGPNSEYPRPHNFPQQTPATYHFDVWDELSLSTRGRRLVKFIADAVRHFPQYA